MSDEFHGQDPQLFVSADALLDASGLRCPLPLLKAKQALNKLKSGQCLHVIATDAGAFRDIPLWCQNAGHQLTQSTDRNGQLHFLIVRA